VKSMHRLVALPVVLSLCAAGSLVARATPDRSAWGYGVDLQSRDVRVPSAVDGLVLRAPSAATNLLVNGSFEQNDREISFTGWSKFDEQGFEEGTDPLQPANGRFFVQSGSALGNVDVPPPTDGRFAAMTIQDGPGLHVLYQNVALPASAERIRFACDVYVDNFADGFVVPSPLSLAFGKQSGQAPLNQHARIDVLRPSAAPNAVGTQILRNVWFTSPSLPTTFGYVTVSADLSDLAGQTVRIRIAEVDNLGTFIFGVDNCSLTATSPGEPLLGQEKQIVPGSVNPLVPTIQYNPDGTRAVIWMQDGGQGTIICIQIIDENDQAVTSPLIVNAAGVLNETPTVGVRPDGTYYIVWRQANGAALRDGDGRVALAAAEGSSIVARGFNPNGTSAGGETVLSTGDAEGSNDPAADTDKNGETAVVWVDGIDNDGKIKGKVVGKNGNPKTGTLDLSAALGPGANKPSVAKSASGDIVACWRQTGGPKQGILCRVLDTNGGPVTDFLQATSALNARAPDVATDDFGNFVVVWEQNANGRDVFGRRYKRNGTPEGPAVVLNQVTAGDQTRPRVSRNATGDFVVVWQGDAAGSANAAAAGSSIVARGFNPSGAAETDDITVAESDAASDPETPDVDLTDKGEATVTFGKKKSNGESGGIFRREVKLGAAPSVCVPDGQTLCLNGSRFRVRSEWKAQNGQRGAGQAVKITNDTGYFTFFDPDNVELVIKALDACGFASSYWVFAAALSDLEVVLVVDDTETGDSISYFSPVGPFQAIRDTAGFANCDAGGFQADPDQVSRLAAATRAELEALAAAELDELGRTREQAGAAACFSTATRLCLNQQRFAVQIEFDTGTEDGPGLRQVLTNDTGYFYFFDPDNVEVVVKVLDACGVNNRYWVFAAGLTDVEVRLTVTDTQTNSSKQYFNNLGQGFVPVTDTSAFATCP
jgi:hypothetical protein